MSKSTRGIRVAGIASLAVSLSIGVAAPAFAVPSFEFDRIGGADRYETAALVADEYGNKPDAILANGQPGFYADALASNYLSKVKDAPILLTRIKELPQSTLDQLDQMGAQRVTVVGGESVVPAEQVAQLESEGYTVTRISGDDRFGTNAEVIGEGGAATGGIGLIATGFNFPDALAAGPFAYQGHPLGLSTKDDVKDEVLDALEADGVKEVLIFGGTDAVGAGVVSDLAARGITVKQRFAGSDRSETSELAAEWALANLGFTNRHVGVASGYTEGYGADALAGGPLEGKEKSPMLITRNVDNPDDVIDYLTKHSDTLETGHLFGGPSAISAAAEAAMEKAAQGSATSAIARPELTGASIISTVTSGQATQNNPKGTVVRYTFDEAFNTADFTKFFVTASNGTSRYTGTAVVASTATTVDIRFGDVDETAEVTPLTVATVDNGAVSQSDGDTNPEGDAALGATSGGGTVNLPAGITEAPDLLSISRVGETESGTGTVVDFTFDEAANTDTPADGDFQVHLLNNTVYSALAANIPDGAADGPSGENTEGGDGTTVITVLFTQDFTAADVARGSVAEGAVVEAVDNDTSDPADTFDANELQAAPLSNSGRTTAPDLESVQLRPDTDTDGAGPDDATDADQALFTFDQNVALAPVVFGNFALYTADGGKVVGTAAEVNTGNRTQVLVTFADDAAVRAVGGNVLANSVTGENGQQNSRDEEGVANTDTASSQTAGKTAGPDLTGVKVAQEKDTFGNITGADVTYTFDEVVDTTTNLTEALFHVYLANGTQVAAPVECVAGPADGAADNNTVVCDFTGPDADLDQAFDGALGTVDYNAVDDVNGAGGIANPEGAERITR